MGRSLCFAMKIWLGEEVILREHFPRLVGLPLELGMAVGEMCPRSGGVGGGGGHGEDISLLGRRNC
jgi:hypothetical protein